MDQLEEFKKVLDDGEQIVYNYKPNKVRYVVLNIVSSALVTLLFTAFLGGMSLLSTIGEHGEGLFYDINIITIILLVLAGIIFLMGSVFSILYYSVKYKKTHFVVTNKRLIIKSGFIGTDFKTLDLKMVQLVDVRVNLFDKICKNNTGTIIFGSAATPIVNLSNSNYANGKNATFAFVHIENAYEISKQIKSYIDSNK